MPLLHPYLFVYGSLRQTEGQLHPLLKQRTNFIGLANLPGKLYLVKNYPGAVLHKQNTQLIVGEVYRLLVPEQLLTELDEYEECSPHFPEPWEYIRSLEQVTLADQSTLMAWVYRFNWSVAGLSEITSGDYSKYQSIFA